jgi:hypothetical protein
MAALAPMKRGDNKESGEGQAANGDNYFLLGLVQHLDMDAWYGSAVYEQNGKKLIVTISDMYRIPITAPNAKRETLSGSLFW